jgi:chaperonin GroES
MIDPQMMQQQPQPPGPSGMPGPQGPMDMAMQPEMGMMPEPPEATPEDDMEDQMERSIDQLLADTNIAEHLEEDLLQKIGDEAVRGFESDLESVGPWLRNNEGWIKLALLLREAKTWPWPNAANIKYPLLATAAMQFSARSYPTLVPSDGNVVKCRPVGYDPDGSRTARGERIAKHMSFQIMERIPDWEEEMDRLLIIEAISGICFKKTYKDATTGKIISRVVFPENLICNYFSKSIEKTFRKTEILPLTQNEYIERVRSGEFIDLGDLGKPSAATAVDTPSEKKPKMSELNAPSSDDGATPHIFLEQHTFVDINDDGYAEPVILYVHKDTKKVARIIARWQSDGVKTNDKGKIIRIVPMEYYTDFVFLPNPDGSIYGSGFGSLLGPINEAVNTLINQLVDAGTLNNLQSGFVSKGLRIQMKDTTFTPGEWKSVNASFDELSKGFFLLPTKEPSGVLFNLMNVLITSGNQLASVADIMVGKMPGQNTPATTTQETVEQSMKVFTAIYKRNFRSLKKEYRKVYNLNKLNPEIVQEESEILNIPISSNDYNLPDDDIIPGADPTGDSATVKAMKMQQVGGLIQMGTINVQEFTKRMLEIADIPNKEQMMQPPPQPQPDPKAQLMQQEMAMKQKDQELKIAEMQAKLDMKERELNLKERELGITMTMKRQETINNSKLKLMETDAKIRREKQLAESKQRLSGLETMHKVARDHYAARETLKIKKEQGAAKPKE